MPMGLHMTLDGFNFEGWQWKFLYRCNGQFQSRGNTFANPYTQYPIVWAALTKRCSYANVKFLSQNFVYLAGIGPLCLMIFTRPSMT